MGSAIIEVSGVSKKYVIGHKGDGAYDALGESVTRYLKNLVTSKKSIKTSGGKKDSKEIFWALDDINFSLNRGDRLGVVGRNGAGKSTLLKVISRITDPSSGKVTMRGRVASLLEVGTGFHPELTGRENIFLNGAILGMSRREIASKFDEIVSFSEVERFLDTPVKRYSSGMYVRLAFSVAAHLEPDLLIVDEVLAVGDTEFQKKCLGKMDDFSKDTGRSVIFVSHQLGTVSSLCNRGILLDKGKLIYSGSAHGAIEEYISSGRRQSSSQYVAQIDRNDPVFFETVSLHDKNSVISDQFGFGDTLRLRIRIRIISNDVSALVSITIIDKMGGYLFTTVESLTNLPGDSNIKEFCFDLTENVFAPNIYSFRLAIFRRNGITYDLLENVCQFRINDNGTKMSLFEGYDYGKVILNYKISDE